MNIARSIARDLRYLFDYQYIASIVFLTGVSLKREYRESFLGILWTLVQPAMHITILSVVFSKIMRFPLENYALYLMCGLLPWTLLTNSFTGGAQSLIARAGLLKGGCVLPKSMFIFSDVFNKVYVFLVSFVTMYLIVGIFFAEIHPSALWFPIVALPTILTCIFASVAFAYLAPYVKDLSHVLTIVMTALFWTVPIVYPITAVPEDKMIFFEINPFYILIRPIQELVHNQAFPSMGDLLLAFMVSFLAAIVSWVVYKLLRKRVVYYL